MSSKEVDNSSGLCPVKEQLPGLSSWTRAQNQIFWVLTRLRNIAISCLSNYLMRIVKESNSHEILLA